jgi:hypothetical protein
MMQEGFSMIVTRSRWSPRQVSYLFWEAMQLMQIPLLMAWRAEALRRNPRRLPAREFRPGDELAVQLRPQSGPDSGTPFMLRTRKLFLGAAAHDPAGVAPGVFRGGLRALQRKPGGAWIRFEVLGFDPGVGGYEDGIPYLHATHACGERSVTKDGLQMFLGRLVKELPNCIAALNPGRQALTV